MISGLLNRFLKKLAGFTADTGNPVGSRKSNSQSGSKSFSLKLATTVLLSIIGCATAFPALSALTIDSATWDGKKLIVQGTDGRGDPVDVFIPTIKPTELLSWVTLWVPRASRVTVVGSCRSTPTATIPWILYPARLVRHWPVIRRS